jgi:AcrR family transcriptional regulator
MTFYRLFKSKTHLVVECLELRDSDWFSLLKKHIERHKDPESRALALFDAFEEWFCQPDYAGCPFIRGLYDFSLEADDREIVDAIQAHFAAIQELVEELLKAVRPKNYTSIMPQFFSLLTGAITVAHVTGSADVARLNKTLARALLAEKLPTKSARPKRRG